MIKTSMRPYESGDGYSMMKRSKSVKSILVDFPINDGQSSIIKPPSLNCLQSASNEDKIDRCDDPDTNKGSSSTPLSPSSSSSRKNNSTNLSNCSCGVIYTNCGKCVEQVTICISPRRLVMMRKWADEHRLPFDDVLQFSVKPNKQSIK
jgi:hypothetical protein